jgi:muramoyltetrapeptide carboxypeptidase
MSDGPPEVLFTHVSDVSDVSDVSEFSVPAVTSESVLTIRWDRSAFGWGLLGRGSKVGVISPSGPVDPQALERGLMRLSSWGFTPVLGRNCTASATMTAGSDEARAADLLWALTDPSLDAVLVSRGGYGLIRTLDLIDWHVVAAAKPRAVVGMSDVTALHEALRVHTSWVSLLGPHVAGLLAQGIEPESSADGPTHDSFLSVLCGEPLGGELVPTGPTTSYWRSARVVRSGSVLAPWVGGNLAVLASLSGSPEGTAPARPFVAVLEDVNEAPYRIDRMLMQLWRAGWFANAVGVVCGGWKGCGDAVEVETVLLDRLGTIDGPIVLDAPFGHGDRHVTLPLGVPISLKARVRVVWTALAKGASPT